VSGNPAAAAGLHDRGRIAPGLRGDLVLLQPDTGAVVATLVAGQVAHMTAEGWGRLH
jgi:alpha-D-ribose 1-methylphosphonate 5-triphosphate diphosphatase